MKSISELYDRHPGADIYILGTGTSVRTFPLNLLDDKITIGLNQAWKMYDPTYSITMMPKLNIPQFMEGEPRDQKTTWVTKPSKVKAQCQGDEIAFAEAHFYGFETDGQIGINGLEQTSEAGRIVDWVKEPHPEKLYLWSSISQSAANLAANMGAKNIILVGCDNCALGENHHAHSQHTQWRGDTPETRYQHYYEGLVEVRAALRTRGVNLVSMSPFLKLDEPETDFRLLCEELEQPVFVENPDIPRGTSLLHDNMRFLRLTGYIMKRNVSSLFTRLSGRGQKPSTPQAS